MAVLGTLIGEKRPGRGSVRSSGGVPILDETYHYLVQMADKTADRIDVLAVPGVPQANVTQSANGYAICKNVDAVRREDQVLYWDVTAVFSSEVDARQDQQTVSGNPTEWIPVYETKFERLQEVVTKDWDDRATANSAGQPFENGILQARFIPIWEFYQFEPATLSDEDIIDRNETLNSTEFKGKEQYTLHLTVMSSVIGFYYGSKLRLTRYALRYNYKKWLHRRLDVGTVYLEGGVHKPYLDDEGNVMLGGLDGAGNKVAPGEPPAVLEFRLDAGTDFNTFLRI